MKHKRYPSAVARDWSLTAWALSETAKNTRQLRGWLVVWFITCIVALAMILYSVLILVWQYLLALGLIYFLARFYSWHKARKKPVPWDDDYKEEEDDIPY